MTILPIGTANNIARALRLGTELDSLAAGLAGAAERRLAVGLARAPWGDARFVESVGLGFLAELIRRSPARRPEPDWRLPPSLELEGAVASVADALAAARSKRVGIEADGADCTGEYLLVEAMNVAGMGPGLDLAPDADASGEGLALVLVGEPDRSAFADYLLDAERQRHAAAPTHSRLVRHLRIEWPPGEGHLDDKPWPEPARDQPSSGPVELEIETTVPVLVPPGAGGL